MWGIKILRRLCNVPLCMTKEATANTKLREWSEKFQNKKISEPEVSAQYILSYVLGKKTFGQLTSHDCNRTLSLKEVSRIDHLCEKRLSHLPIQYVIEEWDFSGLTLKMRPPVFIPRPETGDLVTAVISEINNHRHLNFNLLEIGCGSGAITLALLHALRKGIIRKNLICTAIDADSRAVELATENSILTNLNQYNLSVIHCDITSLPVIGQFDGIVSNPPYIPTNDMKDLQVEISKFESEKALHGGTDGLDLIKIIISVSENLLPLGGWIWLEVDTTHPEILTNIAEKFALTEVKQDIFGRNRFVKLVKIS